MPDIAQLVISLKQQQTVQKLNNVQNKLNKVSKTAKNVGTAFAAGWSVTKIVGLINSIGNAFARQQTSILQFRNIFGNSMSSASQAVKNLTRNFAETETQARIILSSIGAKINQLGLSDNTVAKMSGQIAILAENAAAAFSKPLNNEIINKFTNAINGEVGGLKELGFIIDKNSQSFKTQVELLKQSSGMTQKQAEATAILIELTKQGQKYTGTAKENLNSISKIIQSLKNTFDDVINSKIGRILSAVLGPVLKILEQMIKIPIVAWTISIGTSISILTGLTAGLWIALKKIFSLGWNALIGKLIKISQNNHKIANYTMQEHKSYKEAIKLLNEELKTKKQILAIELLRKKYKSFGFNEKLTDSLTKKAMNIANLPLKDIIALIPNPNKQIAGILVEMLFNSIYIKLITSRSKFANMLGSSLGTLFMNLGTIIYVKAQQLNSPMGKYIFKLIAFANTIKTGIETITKSITKAGSRFVRAMLLSSKKISNYITQFSAEMTGKIAAKFAYKAASNAASQAGSAAVGAGIGAALSKWVKKIGKWLLKYSGVVLGYLLGAIWGIIKLAVKGIIVSLGAIFTSIGAALLAEFYFISGIISKIKTGRWNQYFEDWFSPLFKGFANWLQGVDKNAKKAAQMQKKLQQQIKRNKALNEQTSKLLKQYYVSLFKLTPDSQRKDVLMLNNARFEANELGNQIAKIQYQAVNTKNVEKRNAAAKKLKQLLQKYITLQDTIKQLENSIYDRRKKWYDSAVSQMEWFNGQMQQIDQMQIDAASARANKIADLQRELQAINQQTINNVFGNAIKPEDRIALYKQEQSKLLEIAKLRVQGLKEQFNLAQKFRQFVGNIIQQILQFKSSAVDAMTVNSTQGYKFATSQVGNAMLPQMWLNQNNNQQKRLQQRIEQIQQQSYLQLQKINSNIVNIANRTAGFQVITI